MTKNLLNAAGNMTIIGVLAVQGDFAEHIKVLKRLGVETREVRLPEDLEGLDGLIIPGGESTTIGKVATDFNLMEPLRKFGREKAIWGTCAGAIFLSQKVPLRNEDNEIVGIVGISFDITARKHTEELRKMKALAKEREQTMRVLAASIAHELRTPLSVLQGELEAIKTRNTKPVTLNL